MVHFFGFLLLIFRVTDKLTSPGLFYSSYPVIYYKVTTDHHMRLFHSYSVAYSCSLQTALHFTKVIENKRIWNSIDRTASRHLRLK